MVTSYNSVEIQPTIYQHKTIFIYVYCWHEQNIFLIPSLILYMYKN